MATTFAETAIKFVADSSALKPQLAGIEQQIGKAAQRMGDALKTGILAGTAAIAAATSALVVLLKTTADAGDEIAKLSQRVAIGASTLSGYKLAADLAGVSLQDFGTALQIASRNIFDASRGTGDAAKAFDALGIRVTDNAGKLKTAEQIMLEVADRFAKMEDGAQKTALAMDIFGRSGAMMIPLLNQGAKALAEQRKEAELFGATFNTLQARAAEEFNDTLTRIGAAVKGFVTTVGNLLIPLANEVLGALLAKLKELAESGQLRIWAVQTAEAIVKAFVWAAQAVGELAKASMFVVDSFRTIMAVLQAVRSGFDTFVTAVLAGIQGLLESFGGLAEGFGLAWGQKLTDAAKKVGAFADSWHKASVAAAESAVGWWEAIGSGNEAAEAFAKRLNAMGKSVEDWAGRAIAASIKAAAGIGETGKAATAAGGKWETLEFQVDGVTKSLRVWTTEVSKALPKAAEASVAKTLGAPSAAKPAAPGTMAGILTRAAGPLEEGEERPVTGREWAAGIGRTWEEVLQQLAAQGRPDLLTGIMGRFGTEGELPGMATPSLSADLLGGMRTQAETGLGQLETAVDASMTRIEERVGGGLQSVSRDLPRMVEDWFVRRLESELKRT